MYSIKTPFGEAQKVKQFLIKNNFYNSDYCIFKDKNHIYFPVNSKSGFVEVKKKFSGSSLSQVTLKKRGSKKIKSELSSAFSVSELKKIKGSFDIVGGIAIVEVDPDLVGKEKLIGETILSLNKQIVSVYKKAESYSGEYRTRKLKYLAGRRSKETVHKENAVLLKLDVESCYFSPRTSTERKRISSLIKPGEKILVMFSGVGPLPIVISKNSEAEKIVGVELNPFAYKYSVENVALNKIKNVEFIKGDVKKVLRKLDEKFDRILMPLPKTGHLFVEDALKVAKPNTIIHYYTFYRGDEFPKLKKEVKSYFEHNKIKILDVVKCGQYSPQVFRVCVDIRVIE